MRRILFSILCFILIGFPGLLHAQVPKTTELPDWHIKKWAEVYRPDLTYFARYSAPLGDINGDGYDDFAVTSKSDTTYIFFGGDTLSHVPAYRLQGGSSGVCAADFNRDGRMDIVTAIHNWPPGEYPPDFTGKVRVYYQKEGAVKYDWEPDLLIEGKPQERVGKTLEYGYRNSVFAPDFNGDGWPDLLVMANDLRESVRYKAVLYLGGPEMDAEYDVEFLVTPPLAATLTFALDILTGDINGDGYDEILIAGADTTGNVYWNLYLGNSQAAAGIPTRVIRQKDGWAPKYGRARMMDIDNDGYQDILDIAIHREFGDALMFRGKAELPLTILPNDSIPNATPGPYADISPTVIAPVGDMNGDGKPDLIMGWSNGIFWQATRYYFYPGGAEFRTPLGFFGTSPNVDYVDPGVYPAGDVNGDGYDDVITLGSGSKHGLSCRFQIWVGAKQLATSVGQSPHPESPSIHLSPNPISQSDQYLTIHATGLRPGTARILVSDMLGRAVIMKRLDSPGSRLHHSMNIPQLTPGLYFVTVTQNTTVLHSKLLVR
ncbi:T9SS type A sorting domain-containing protein [bacterium]|nr:T9SS type A sorting domain-containing protein [bacterium]